MIVMHNCNLQTLLFVISSWNLHHGWICSSIVCNASTCHSFAIILANFIYVCFQACLLLLHDPYPLLGMCTLLPLLKAIDKLITFVQKQDVYICDFVAAIKIC